MSKKGIPHTATVSFVFVFMMFLFSFQSNLSLLSRSNVTSSITKSKPVIVSEKREEQVARSSIQSGIVRGKREEKPELSPSHHSGAVTKAREDKRAPSPSRAEVKNVITCDCSHDYYDMWSINGPTLLDPITSTFFAIGATDSTPPDFTVKFHPYPRKTDENAKSKVNELTLTSAPPKSSCGVTHSSPAIVFSTGGYTGNFYHQFNDVLLALYITVNSLSLNQDVILVVTNWSEWWVKKNADLLHQYTKHPIVNMDNQTRTHCFPSAIIGLITHGPFVVDPALLPQHETLLDFHALLENTYGPRGGYAPASDRPQIVLVNRRNGVGREILNLKEVLEEIEEVGFKAIVFEPKRDAPVRETYTLLHGCHAMVGVHGAALTHLLFLRAGTVLGEIVPIGADWLAKTYFERPAGVLGLEYMKYKIEINESSLAERYGADDLVLKNPSGFVNGNYSKAKVYMKTQNVKLDIVRFRVYIKEVFVKAQRFMDNEG
uniref:Glycosyltransferase 61 catalytic domain-containing protein n=1 Tax=Salix viminalis TaxID=40686 RepID=A0A6N2LRY4_SALVM